MGVGALTGVVNLFAGVGWDFAADDLALTVDGIDIELTVAATRSALGWSTTVANVVDLNPTDWAGVEGLIASPPCQSWSRAGKGLGLDDPRGELVWQPLAWALAIRPRWVACEQVPEASAAFAMIAYELRAAGYHAAVYHLSAETVGVAQTRRRVFLTAHRDRQPRLPTLTHQRYRKGRARLEPTDLIGHLPWVSMAEALCRDGTLDTRCGWLPPIALDERPAPTLTAVAGGKAQWLLHPGRRARRADRRVDEPAPTLTAHVGRDGESWAFHRPSTTICADPRVSAPVHHHGAQSTGAVAWPTAGADKPIALTESQGCRLMGFPDGVDAVLAGSKQARWRLIGNAVCPPVAAAVLATLVEAA